MPANLCTTARAADQERASLKRPLASPHTTTPSQNAAVIQRQARRGTISFPNFHGELVYKQGWVMKRGAINKAYKMRYLRLFQRRIAYYKDDLPTTQQSGTGV